jgi:diketogulonate reductase-like aldo/keto reductase
VETAVVSALEAGYRHIDCAYGYGNETEVGAAVKQVIASGKLSRQDIFLVSKLWNTRHNPEDVKPSLKESLTMLGVDYLDLYLIHWPHCFKAGPEMFPMDDQGNILYGDVHFLETWKAMEDCVDEGLIKSIGVSNFNSRQVQELLDKARIKPAVLQIEVNPYFQQDKLVAFCQERGVAVTAYSCLGAPERPWADQTQPRQLDDPVIVEIAGRLGRTPAQVILRWLLQRNIVVIPKSVTPARIVQNFQISDFELSAADMEKMRSVNKNIRSLAPIVERNGKMEFRDLHAPNFPFVDDIEF